MVFGVFDGLHEGHKFLLTEAAKGCEELVVVVTPDETVKLLKKRFPKHPYSARSSAITQFNSSLKVIPGDEKPGQWTVLADHRPDMVFLGYDQQAIADELKKIDIPFTFLAPHHPHKYKSSLLDSDR